jgi:hypothetical protein
MGAAPFSPVVRASGLRRAMKKPPNGPWWNACSPSSRAGFVSYAGPWIARHKLTGVLTAYPLDVGCLDWAVENGRTGMSPDKLAQKLNDPSFVGSFSTAAQEHFHYEDGVRVS